MSHNVLNDAGQSPESQTPPAPNLTDLAVITSSLNETAQALLNLTKKAEDDIKMVNTSINEGYTKGEFHNEIRSYRVSAFIVQMEQELLSQHNEPDLISLLFKERNNMLVIITFMCNAYEIETLPNLELPMIGGSLEHSLSLFTLICSYLTDFELLNKTIASV